MSNFRTSGASKKCRVKLVAVCEGSRDSRHPFTEHDLNTASPCFILHLLRDGAAKHARFDVNRAVPKICFQILNFENILCNSNYHGQ